MGVAVFQVVFCAVMDEAWMCRLLVRSTGEGAKQTVEVGVCEATSLLASQVNTFCKTCEFDPDPNPEC